MNKLLLTILLIGIVYNTFAYPIEPRPLRKLVIESEYIVYADVIRIEKTKTKKKFSNTVKAILAIKETLQGEIKADTIAVNFRPNMICPAPANYIKGTTVLAFLDKTESGYKTHALSYGSRIVSATTFETFKSRIKEMQNISELKNEAIKAEKTIDWLVTCATNSDTRWEGVYELSPESDFMSYYDKEQEAFIRNHELNDNQKSRLREVLFTTQKLNYSDLGLIDLVVKKDDIELINFLKEQLKEMEIDDFWHEIFLIRRIAEFTDRDDLRKIADEIEQLNYLDENRKEKSKQLTLEFIEKI